MQNFGELAAISHYHFSILGNSIGGLLRRKLRMHLGVRLKLREVSGKTDPKTKGSARDQKTPEDAQVNTGYGCYGADHDVDSSFPTLLQKHLACSTYVFPSFLNSQSPEDGNPREVEMQVCKGTPTQYIC